MSDLNLFQRVNEVRKAIDYIQKDKAVSTGSGSYKAVTHDQVTAMVRDHMVKHGIVCFPVLVDSLMNPKEVNASMEVAKQARYEATYDFVFVNCDNPEDRMTIRIQSHAMDNADKAPGKALSYAKKYAVLKLFEIETGEDDESRYSQDEAFNAGFYLQSISGCTSLEDLQSMYLEAKEAAMKAGDAPAFKSITHATNQMKTRL